MTKIRRRRPPPTPTRRTRAPHRRDTRQAEPNEDRMNFRFVVVPGESLGCFLVVDRIDDSIAHGTDPAGYLEFEDAREAKARCSLDQGAWL